MDVYQLAESCISRYHIVSSMLFYLSIIILLIIFLNIVGEGCTLHCIISRGIPFLMHIKIQKYDKMLSFSSDDTTTAKPLIPSIWCRPYGPLRELHRLSAWIILIHSFPLRNMSSLWSLASIHFHITSIYVFFNCPFNFLTCPMSISSTHQLVHLYVCIRI